jgi:hypothetical protein
MTIDRLRVHYGFERMPFAKNLAAGTLITLITPISRQSRGSDGVSRSGRSA